MVERNLLVRKGIILVSFITLICSTGVVWLLLSNRSNHQTQIKQPKSLSAVGVANQQSSAPNIGTTNPVNTPIFEAPKQFQGKVIRHEYSKDKVIALTFDDGPAPKYTEQILEILKKNNIKATFFCLGEMVHNFPEIAKQEVADGEVIGNHTWHHWYKKMNASTAADEIESTATQIYKTMGVKTFLFRPPGGILNNGVADYAKKNNYAVLMWSDDSQDYRRPSVSKLVSNVLKEAKPGGIVLMHDGGGDRSNTVKALPKIIDALRNQGYQFVTVPQLLEMEQQEPQLTKPGQLHQPIKHV